MIPSLRGISPFEIPPLNLRPPSLMPCIRMTDSGTTLGGLTENPFNPSHWFRTTAFSNSTPIENAHSSKSLSVRVVVQFIFESCILFASRRHSLRMAKCWSLDKTVCWAEASLSKVVATTRVVNAKIAQRWNSLFKKKSLHPSLQYARARCTMGPPTYSILG